MRILLVGLLIAGCGGQSVSETDGEVLPGAGTSGAAQAGAAQGGQTAGSGGAASAGAASAGAAGSSSGGSAVDPCTMGPCPNGGTYGRAGSNSGGGTTSEGGEGGAPEAGGATNDCPLPPELECHHVNPSGLPELPDPVEGKMYDQGERVWASGHAYECYQTECSGGGIYGTVWKPLWWDGCDWTSLCELPEYDACHLYISKDSVTWRDEDGHQRAYFCNDQPGACNEHSPSEGATYIGDDGWTKAPIWKEYDWSFGANGYVCWFF